MGALRANNLKKLFVHSLGTLGRVPRFRVTGADVTCGNFRCQQTCTGAFTSHGGWLGVGGVARGDPTPGHVVHGWGLTNGVSRKWANGRSLLYDVTSCYILWPMAARQQYSASGGRRQLMQGVFRASMVSNLWHFHHVALPQHNIQLACCCLVTACVLAPKDCFTSDSNVFPSRNLALWPFRTATDLHTGYPRLIVN